MGTKLASGTHKTCIPLGITAQWLGYLPRSDSNANTTAKLSQNSKIARTPPFSSNSNNRFFSILLGGAMDRISHISTLSPRPSFGPQPLANNRILVLRQPTTISL